MNEPWIIGLLGYLHGLHAPGIKNDVRGECTAFHHVLLAHGLAVAELRASGRDGRAGVAFSLAPHYAASDDPADAEVARLSDGYVNRWFLDPVLRGSYPDDLRALWEERIGDLDFVRDGDLATINGGDFVGVNYYARRVMQAVPGDEPWPWRVVTGGAPTTEGGTEGVPMTEAGTEITPQAFTDLLVRLHRDYPGVPLLITENGAVFEEPVHDEQRIGYIHDHLAAVHDAIAEGAPVLGYCHWSFLDNFEWALGYAQRFGLVHVDYDTFARTVKDSGRDYRGAGTPCTCRGCWSSRWSASRSPSLVRAPHRLAGVGDPGDGVRLCDLLHRARRDQRGRRPATSPTSSARASPRPEAVSLLFRIGTPLGEIGSWALLAHLCPAGRSTRSAATAPSGAVALVLLPGAWLVHVDHIFSPRGVARHGADRGRHGAAGGSGRDTTEKFGREATIPVSCAS